LVNLANSDLFLLPAFRVGKSVPTLCVAIDSNEEQRAVQIVAIGEKEGNRLIVGGEEVEL
jgi:hypothetical protein